MPLYKSSAEVVAALTSVYLVVVFDLLSTLEVSVPNLGLLLVMEAADPSFRELEVELLLVSVWRAD